MNIFGPFTSPRFGRALGINNVPKAVCTYTCQYCPSGQIAEMPTDRRAFASPQIVATTIAEKVNSLRQLGESLDYLAFMPDGEPTLELNLGQIFKRLEPIGIKIAVITNASLIWQYRVQQDLLRADWVCFKIDAVQEDIWREINKPHPSKYLLPILEGMQTFRSDYQRYLVTETTLIEKVNDDEAHLAQMAHFLSLLHPNTAYLSIFGPISAPFHPPDPAIVEQAYRLFSERLIKVEYLGG